ncbi:MAG TPA: acetyl-CoA carboxylase biotin carboxylase subunit, partial [Candidatus Bathyarchaeia archaeon]|nr:acetyl-CoA carboxylase biotin carboxylase subunit [Candidatus Bathyarchaeia archaeon]
MFGKILIANRGEIAVRIVRTCRRLGIKTVAVYSEPDIESLHVTMADEAYEIGPGPASESYLNIPRIIKVSKSSRVDALHPGYGFLAESPLLARACEEAGLVFIGPRSNILASESNKFESRERARKAGVPIVPGSKKQLESSDEAETEAKRLGFPVLVKASFGGGGRGMRTVNSERELQRSIEVAAAEAMSAFGRPELYLEKYLRNPRHIEVQVIAGAKGRVVHLGERECSMQRRHQKILEETPSPRLDLAARKRLVSLAMKVAKASRYENAGTVEFVRSERGAFYYLEINKRIQVEHLITEMVTGIDIVEQQLRIASGEGLGVSQSEVTFNGAALNCRINAEDPSRNFAPAPGRVEQFVAPGGIGVRVDTSLFNGAPVPEYYDSLIAKIACSGRSREETIRRMKGALSETIIAGVETTLPVHEAILEDKGFLRGEYHTQLLDEKISTWDLSHLLSREEVAMLYLTTKYKSLRAKEFRSKEIERWRDGLREEPGTRQPLFVE